MESFKEVFNLVQEFCRTQGGISDVAYRAWIAVIEPVKFEDSTAYLHVRTFFTKTIIEEKYLPLLHQAFEAVCAGWLEESGLGPQQIQCGRIAYQPDLGCLHLPASASCTLAFGPEEEAGDTIRDLIIRSEIL